MNKCAIVTGASRGIGRAVAKRLARDGFSLALIYKNSADKAAELAEELECDAKIYKCDISESNSVNNTVEKIIEDFSGVFLLVNNAGIAQQKLFTDITDRDWQEMLSVNLSGAFYFSRAVLPYMIHNKSGKIINIASMWGETGGALLCGKGRHNRNDKGACKGNGAFGDNGKRRLPRCGKNRYAVLFQRTGA